MRSGASARVSDIADDCSSFDADSFLNRRFGQVQVTCRNAVAVIYFDHVAVSGIIGSVDNQTVAGDHNFLPHAGRDVYAFMKFDAG